MFFVSCFKYFDMLSLELPCCWDGLSEQSCLASVTSAVTVPKGTKVKSPWVSSPVFAEWHKCWRERWHFSDVMMTKGRLRVLGSFLTSLVWAQRRCLRSSSRDMCVLILCSKHTQCVGGCVCDLQHEALSQNTTNMSADKHYKSSHQGTDLLLMLVTWPRSFMMEMWLSFIISV